MQRISRARRWWKVSVPAVVVLFSFFLIVACEDDPTDIGLELKSALGKVQPVYVDTLRVYSSTWSRDSMRTDHSSSLILGNILDPVFGWTDASFVTQYRLTAPWIPGNNADVDSVKLFLVIGDYTGNEVTPMTVDVYESFRHIRYDTVYYSNFEMYDSISVWPVGSATFHPEDTMVVVYLSKTFGRRIIRDTAALQDNKIFTDHFPGLYITTRKSGALGEGGFAKVNLLDAKTYLAIYYHNDLADKLTYGFGINTYCARIGLYKHHYDEAPPETAVRYLDQEKEDTVLYVQGLAGVYSKLTIPGLQRYRDSLVVLNNVRLVIPFHNDPMGAIMRKPSILALRVRLGDSLFIDVADRQVPDLYNGRYDEEKEEYVINFTAQVQQYLLKHNDDLSFYLMTDYPAFDMERVVLNGWNNSRPLKLILIYTEL